MSILDAILLIACACSLARWPLAPPLALITVIVTSAITIALDGWRTPLAPAYAVGFASAIAAFLPIDRLPQRWQWIAMGAGALLLTISLVSSVALPPLTFPETSGQFGVGTVDVPAALVERFTASLSRPRPAPAVRLWYPTAPGAPRSRLMRRLFGGARRPGSSDAPLVARPARFPVVLYFAGWPGTAIQNFVLIRELTSRGFVVASLIYPAKLPHMSDAEFAGHQADFDSPWDYSTPQKVDRMRQLFEARVRHGSEDAAAMLDLLAAINGDEVLPQFRGRLSLEHAGVMGFSMGGSTAAQAGWLDPRFKAVVNLDGWHWHEAADQGVPRPYLYMSERLSEPRAPDLTAQNLDTRSAAERQLFEFTVVPRNLARNGGMWVSLPDASHSNFTDLNLRSPLQRLRQGGSIDRFRALAIVNAYVCTFFERELMGRTEPLLDEQSPLYPEVQVRIWPSAQGR